MEGEGLSTFRFPRINQKKIYRWKKMNFTTNLPKRRPIVTYLVASSFTTNSIPTTPEQVYRMHVVVPFGGKGGYLLCHVRRVAEEKQDNEPKE